MPISHDVDTWDGKPLLTRDGDKIGQIQSIYLDGDTEQPAWLAVKTGKLSSAVSLVPVERATPSEQGVKVPYDKKHIKHAPTFKPDDEISPDDARALYEHYAIGGGGSPAEPAAQDGAADASADDVPEPAAEYATGAAPREPINQTGGGA
jgi:hypothetical protein